MRTAAGVDSSASLAAEAVAVFCRILVAISCLRSVRARWGRGPHDCQWRRTHRSQTHFSLWRRCLVVRDVPIDGLTDSISDHTDGNVAKMTADLAHVRKRMSDVSSTKIRIDRRQRRQLGTLV